MAQNVPPVLDFSVYSLSRPDTPTDEELRPIAISMLDALQQYGLFYLKSSGFPELVNELWTSSTPFFNLPKDVKIKYRNETVEAYRGYLLPDKDYDNKWRLGQKLTEEGKEGFIYIPAYKQISTLPSEDVAPGFMTSLTHTFERAAEVLGRVFEALALSMQKERLYFTTTFLSGVLGNATTENDSSIRLNYFRPIAGNIDEDTRRLVEHKDRGGMTLLLTDGQGLQFQDRDGAWVDVPPHQGTVLVIAGMCLEVWTNRGIVAPMHRVLAGAQKDKTETKTSIVLFLTPDMDLPVETMDGTRRLAHNYREFATGVPDLESALK